MYVENSVMPIFPASSGAISCSIPSGIPSAVKKSRYKALQSDSDATGLVSILTSDTNPPIVLPSNEHLRLKRLQKTVRVSAQVIQEHLQNKGYRFKTAMVTLTYRDDVVWTAKQVTSYIKCVREWARRKGITVHYVWVLELTKKGRPHYHVMWWLPKGVSMPKADKQGWWKHGFTKSEWARSPVGYLCKYTSKGVDKESWGKIPRGSRLHGNGGFNAPLRLVKAWYCAPAWVRAIISFNDKARKKGRYWVNVRSGMGIQSPYSYSWQDRTLRWIGFSDPVDIDCLPSVPVSDAPAARWQEYDLMTLNERIEPISLQFFVIDQAMRNIAKKMQVAVPVNA